MDDKRRRDAIAIGLRIRAARKAKKLSQHELSVMLPGAADTSYVSRWENGRHIPEAYFRPLAKALDVTQAWLRYGDESSEDDDEPSSQAA
jgi:transcriptional regulator with XRE-family HTH domain